MCVNGLERCAAQLRLCELSFTSAPCVQNVQAFFGLLNTTAPEHSVLCNNSGILFEYRIEPDPDGRKQLEVDIKKYANQLVELQEVSTVKTIIAELNFLKQRHGLEYTGLVTIGRLSAFLRRSRSKILRESPWLEDVASAEIGELQREQPSQWSAETYNEDGERLMQLLRTVTDLCQAEKTLRKLKEAYNELVPDDRRLPKKLVDPQALDTFMKGLSASMVSGGGDVHVFSRAFCCWLAPDS